MSNFKPENWSRCSWRGLPAEQLPEWPDQQKLKTAYERLCKLPPLVFAGEARRLKGLLHEACLGKAFVLQAGDCAELFSRCHGPDIRDLLKVILQIAVILTYAGEKRLINIGRMAGQYAKPRSSSYEKLGHITLPVYRGDMVNSLEPTLEARTHDPGRMVEGYFCSAATLNLVRAFTNGGFASLDNINSWNLTSFGKFHQNPDYEKLCCDIRKAVNFFHALGNSNLNSIQDSYMYTSHEALLLDYEEAMTRIDTTTGEHYDTSAHMLWIGYRTRYADGAHVEFMRGIKNPIGIKIGPEFSLDELKPLIEALNPDNEPGRLSLITRFGNQKIYDFLPELIETIKREGMHVVWICDPMHGNTKTDSSGRKTRAFEDILAETRAFFQIHQTGGTHPGGIHLELSGTQVAECTGGIFSGDFEHGTGFQSACDPRLNAEQGVELAFEIAKLLKSEQKYD